MDDVGAVILHWRHWPAVADTIACALAEGLEPTNIVVVDNASGDGSVAHIMRAFPQIVVVELPRNRGYAAGMNAGMSRLGRRDALLLTHETVMLPGTVAALRSRLAANPRVGVVGPLVLYKDDPATVFSEGGRFNRRMAISHLANGEPAQDHDRDEPRRVDWLDGCCLLVRRELVDAVGTFDEGFFLYYEETDFMARATRGGWMIECAPRARALQQPSSRPQALWTRNRLRFLRRNANLRTFVRQVAVDVRAVAFGPDRSLTALGLAGYFLRLDPAMLYRRSF